MLPVPTQRKRSYKLEVSPDERSEESKAAVESLAKEIKAEVGLEPSKQHETMPSTPETPPQSSE
jgi:hypothetical protein